MGTNMTQKTNSTELLQPVDINKLIHEPARLMIMSYLYVLDKADFVFLANQTGFSGGNLSAHISKLKNAEFVKVEKEFLKDKPHTILSLTDSGRRAFKEYQKNMKKFLDELQK
jgi:DNA-binding MarR family transcriptional regulator